MKVKHIFTEVKDFDRWFSDQGKHKKFDADAEKKPVPGTASASSEKPVHGTAPTSNTKLTSKFKKAFKKYLVDVVFEQAETINGNNPGELVDDIIDDAWDHVDRVWDDIIDDASIDKLSTEYEIEDPELSKSFKETGVDYENLRDFIDELEDEVKREVKRVFG